MRESSGSDQSTRSEVAPPLVTSRPVQRTGYAVLAAGGLVLATAFGGIAELATNQQSSGATGELASSSAGGSPRGGQGASGRSDDDRTRTVDGVAVAGSSTAAPRERTGSPEPTTVVRIGPDGEPTTTTITPRKPPERSSRDDGTGHPGTGADTGESSTSNGGGTSTDNSGDNDDGDGDGGTTSPGDDSGTSDPPTSGGTTPPDTSTPTSSPTETTGPTSSDDATSTSEGPTSGDNDVPTSAQS